jgi:hypothetical protein
MLLSFAQFEREITGERIYDKHSRKAARPPRADVSRTFSGEHLALRVRSHLNPTTNYAEVAYRIAPAWQGCPCRRRPAEAIARIRASPPDQRVHRRDSTLEPEDDPARPRGGRSDRTGGRRGRVQDQNNVLAARPLDELRQSSGNDRPEPSRQRADDVRLSRRHASGRCEQ